MQKGQWLTRSQCDIANLEDDEDKDSNPSRVGLLTVPSFIEGSPSTTPDPRIIKSIYFLLQQPIFQQTYSSFILNYFFLSDISGRNHLHKWIGVEAVSHTQHN